MSEPIIKVENVSMRFNLAEEKTDTIKEYILKLIKGKLHFSEFWALKDISFTVNRGESVALIGRNGSGKSTLLKLIAGVMTASKGKITVGGEIAPLIELGAGFDLDLSGRENIYLNGAVMGFDHKYMDAHFEEILEFSELRDFIDVPVKNYSSGMIARLGFSIATITKPDILIVDEVLAVGDENFQKKCINKIHSLLENNTTLLFVSHNSDTVQEICNRAIWLDGGKLMIDADSKTACDAYRGI
ncbi:MAG: ABC transporter ATP-binding protein [Oscillospiraceae bacterium]|nr:ABC transporter ATP-binding protein [Oscillospiraceae bacterium]